MIPFSLTMGYCPYLSIIDVTIHPNLAQEEKRSSSLLFSLAHSFATFVAMCLTWTLPDPTLPY